MYGRFYAFLKDPESFLEPVIKALVGFYIVFFVSQKKDVGANICYGSVQ